MAETNKIKSVYLMLADKIKLLRTVPPGLKQGGKKSEKKWACHAEWYRKLSKTNNSLEQISTVATGVQM